VAQIEPNKKSTQDIFRFCGRRGPENEPALKVPAQPKEMDDGTEEMEDALWREEWDLWVEIFNGLNGRYGVEGPTVEQE
jgi:hypothetical protein